MNITDVRDEDVPVVDGARKMAAIIFARQSSLEDKYWEIERRPSKIVSVNSRYGQVLIKDFLWRAMEEMAEHLDAVDPEHRKEELADALHFVTGLCVVLDKQSVFLNCVEHSLEPTWGGSLGTIPAVVRYSGLVGNCLKMKPWKQTDVLTDEDKFNHQLGMYIVAFFKYCYAEGFTLEQMFKLYWKKSEVNLFRQRSKY